jgi:hypothetical protein
MPGVSDDYGTITTDEFGLLLAGAPLFMRRLAAGERLRAETRLRYPGRKGAVFVYFTPSAQDHDKIRISDGGGLLKSLEDQGMDLSVDMIISKTVFHVIKETEGGFIVGGQVYMDTSPEKLIPDAWRFIQMLIELVGLRHSKYKDALVQLAKRQGTPDLLGFDES